MFLWYKIEMNRAKKGYKWDTAIISYIYINLFVLRYKTNRTYVFGDCKRLKKANRVRLDSMHEIIPRIGQTTFWEIIVSSSFSFLSYTFIYIYIFSFLNSFSHISFLILLYFSKAFARYEDVLSIFSSSFSFFFFFLFVSYYFFLFFF